mgnify:CR=1 FL=1
MEQPGELEFSQLLFGGVAFVVLLSAGIVAFILLYQRKLHRQAVAMQVQELNYQKNLTGMVVQSQEMERERISQDLHDEIGVSLSAAKLYINQIRYETVPEEMKGLADEANVILERTVQEIRRIAQNLSPLSIAEFGFASAIEMLLTRIRTAGVRTSCEIKLKVPLTEEQELSLYRIIQETTGNALKHAGADIIEVRLIEVDRELILTVSDNGCGFDTVQTEHPEKRSMGLSGIKARANLLNAGLNISSVRGKGTSIELRIPIG